MSIHRLFSYGTLRLPGVQAAVFGREPHTVEDVLVGYRLEWVTITDASVIEASGSDQHPILRIGDSNDIVAGAYLELTDAELARADAYEVDDYVRVAATLRSGLNAWVYVGADGRPD